MPSVRDRRHRAQALHLGGGTYAREFKKGASFGVNMPWIENPDWVGGEHGPDEGVSEELLKTSFKIYVLALAELQGVEDRVEALSPRPCFPGPAFAAGLLRLGVGGAGIGIFDTLMN